MSRYKVKSKLGIKGLLDELIGATLSVGARHGLPPNNLVLKELRRAIDKILRRALIESNELGHSVIAKGQENTKLFITKP